MTIQITQADYAALLAHARAELPNEACGLLAGQADGTVRRIQKIYCLTNTDHSPEHFSLDPREQLAAVKDMRANGLQPLGNFHSHPASPARPSAEDIRLAYDANASYLILSLAGEAPVLKGFRIAGGAAEAVEMLVV
ncbi:MAG: M67 family metallopeptidase [Oscillospiraceae bacterium]|jgi:proteasome lid subunit RPN8/RPN11|nr:M67 family metallopeptidase [Oscillospiraceae bacterium]